MRFVDQLIERPIVIRRRSGPVPVVADRYAFSDLEDRATPQTLHTAHVGAAAQTKAAKGHSLLDGFGAGPGIRARRHEDAADAAGESRQIGRPPCRERAPPPPGSPPPHPHPPPP